MYDGQNAMKIHKEVLIMKVVHQRNSLLTVYAKNTTWQNWAQRRTTDEIKIRQQAR